MYDNDKDYKKYRQLKNRLVDLLDGDGYANINKLGQDVQEQYKIGKLSAWQYDDLMSDLNSLGYTDTQATIVKIAASNTTSNKPKDARDKFDDALNKLIEESEFTKDADNTQKILGEYLGDEEFDYVSDNLKRLIDEKKVGDPYGLKTLLRNIYGANAEFRDGQEDAIISVLNGKKTLVLQHTGWGKSLVYFLSIKKLRQNCHGPAIVISPLLALIHDQMDKAINKFELKAATISSENQKDWADIYSKISKGLIDVLFIAPERLADNSFAGFIKQFSADIPLFVVDEAHCISDWGHDFRPDFRRIVRFINGLVGNTPILATTATANERVIRDIRHQIGTDMEILRGTMDRPSIDIEIQSFRDNYHKLLWLKNSENRLQGSGIIYCLTIRHCEEVVRFLRKNLKKRVEIYHAKLQPEEKQNIEKEFQANKIDILVCTIAFGMGIDKPDIAFVIHFQQPANIIAYYQQIGRAGRGIDHSEAIMLVGPYDNNINKFFIENAFPPMKYLDIVMQPILTYHGGIGVPVLKAQIERENKHEKFWYKGWFDTWLDKILKYLDVNFDIKKWGNQYYKTKKEWTTDDRRARIVTYFRWKELKQFNQFIKTDDCYMQVLRTELGDKDALPCGHCFNCIKKNANKKGMPVPTAIGIPVPAPTPVTQTRITAATSLANKNNDELFAICEPAEILTHKTLGDGIVLSRDSQYVYIEFENGEAKEFNYNGIREFFSL